MPIFDYNPERAKKKQAETLGSMKGAWEAVKNAFSSPEGLKNAALGVAKMGTFPFSALGQTDWGDQGLMDVADNPAQAVSPWMMMKRAAEEEKLAKVSGIRDLMERWQSGGQQSAREELGRKMAELSPELKKTQLHKLMKQTDVRRNPDTKELEFYLFRGTGLDEALASAAENKTVKATTSFSPWPKVAQSFSMPGAVEGWVPESRILGVPKELGSYSGHTSMEHPGFGKYKFGKEPIYVPNLANDFKSEYEVLVAPETPMHMVNPSLGRQRLEEYAKQLEKYKSDPRLQNYVGNQKSNFK